MGQQQSSMGMVSMVLGIIGLAMVAFSCCFTAMLLPGCLISGAAVILGWLEIGKINRGEVTEDGRGQATVGMGLGGTGCAIGVLYGLACLVFMVLYMALIVFGAIAGNM